MKIDIRGSTMFLKKIASTPGHHRKCLQAIWVDFTGWFWSLNFLKIPPWIFGLGRVFEDF